jgi:hypothetical protein
MDEAAERLRFEQLLGVSDDVGLHPCAPDPETVQGAAWASAYADEAAGIVVSGYLVADPQQREEIARQHDDGGNHRSSTNGALLLIAQRDPSHDDDSDDRFLQLLSRFAGDE